MKKSLKMFIFNMIIMLVILCILNANLVFAESSTNFTNDTLDNFDLEITTENNTTKYYVKNAKNYIKDSNYSLEDKLFLLKSLGFNNSFINNMSIENIDLLCNSSYLEITKKEYVYNEFSNNTSSLFERTLNSIEYNSLTLTTIMNKIYESSNESHYVISFLVEWKKTPINKLKDLMFIVCNNEEPISSSYRECYMSYYTSNSQFVKYTNLDSTNKINTFNTITTAESWSLNIPFTTSMSNLSMFMQSEFHFNHNNSQSSIICGYFHQILAGPIGVNIEISETNITFSPKYTMDTFISNLIVLE